MRNAGLGALLLLVLAAGSAPAGTLRTLDGKVYRGEVRWDDWGGLSVGKGASAVHVDLDGVLQVAFAESKPGAPDASPGARPIAGVILRGGTIIAGQVRQLDDAQVRLSRAKGGDLAIPAAQVARIYYRTISPELLGKLPGGRTGVLLASGDFAEGEAKGADDGTVRLNSLIFGLRRFEQRDTAAIVLRDESASPTQYRVTTADGSVLMAKSVRVQKEEALVDEQTLGAIKLQPSELAEISAGSVRFRALTELQPENPAGGRHGWVVGATTTGAPMVLGHSACERGIGMAAGASVTYKLDGAYQSFMCRAGVPAGILPASAVRFIVAVDGKVVYRSPDRASLDDPLNVVVGLSGGRELTLRVEAAGVSEVGATGLWGDPALVK